MNGLTIKQAHLITIQLELSNKGLAIKVLVACKSSKCLWSEIVKRCSRHVFSNFQPLRCVLKIQIIDSYLVEAALGFRSDPCCIRVPENNCITIYLILRSVRLHKNYMSVFLFACLFIWLYVNLFDILFICLWEMSVHLSDSLSISSCDMSSLSIFLSIYLSVYLLTL